MRRPHPPLIAGLLLAPLLSSCFASQEDNSSLSGSSDTAAGARLRVALAFAPTEHYSPYGQDAFIMSRLGVSEGLTRLDANGTAIPALAESWSSEKGDRSWVFTLRHARFQDGTEVTAEAVAAALTHAAGAEPAPTALTGVKLTARAEAEDRVRVGTGTARRVGCARTARTPPAGRSVSASWPYAPPPSRAPASSPRPANP